MDAEWYLSHDVLGKHERELESYRQGLTKTTDKQLIVTFEAQIAETEAKINYIKSIIGQPEINEATTSKIWTYKELIMKGMS